MVSKLKFAMSTMLSLSSGFSYGQAGDCVALAKVIGLEITRSAGSFERLSVQTYNFCQKDYSEASETEKKSIEANYGAVGGKGSIDRTSIQKKQSEVCEGKFGFEYAQSANTADSQRMNKAAGDVIKACYQSNTVKVVDASFSDQVVNFIVFNGTKFPAEIRSVTFQPADMMEKCDVTNDERSVFLGTRSIPVQSSINVTCTPKGRAVDKGNKTFGGGFVILDVPGSTVPPMPVPKTIEKPYSSESDRLAMRVKELEASLAETKTAVDAAKIQLTAANDLNTRLRKAAVEAQDSALTRTHVFTINHPRLGPNTPRFHMGESVGIMGVSNWGALSNSFAASTCNNKYVADWVSNYEGPRVIGLFMCKVDFP